MHSMTQDQAPVVIGGSTHTPRRIKPLRLTRAVESIRMLRVATVR
jgi:hypothetical protein